MRKNTGPLTERALVKKRAGVFQEAALLRAFCPGVLRRVSGCSSGLALEDHQATAPAGVDTEQDLFFLL